MGELEEGTTIQRTVWRGRRRNLAKEKSVPLANTQEKSDCKQKREGAPWCKYVVTEGGSRTGRTVREGRNEQYL